MSDWSGFEPRDPSLEPQAPTERSPSRILARTVALLEVLLCSDYPTQLALGATFAVFGFSPYTSGRLSVAYVVTLSLLDTALLLGLMVLLLTRTASAHVTCFWDPGRCRGKCGSACR